MPVSLSVDNQGARDLAYNPEHHPKTKHIDRKHFYIRELVEMGRISVPFVPTEDNVADFFTKPLVGKRFDRLRSVLMNIPAQPELHLPRSGGSAPAPALEHGGVSKAGAGSAPALDSRGG